MLQLKNITKQYQAGTTRVDALRGLDLSFRESEFVAILGPSGCGKTTLLNIVGGLDQYTTGDLVINGKSTKDYKDADWDSYRNHSIGFVFQSYNLIPHQTVLSNVELALTLSGVSKADRRARALEVLEKVGLGDQTAKTPNQLSGGQMQRVAIARALVNNPDILLADEPTGALDSETSVQVMELLKEIAADKLVIMVTHNPDLADTYATRIVRLLDGQITSDSHPYDGTEAAAAAEYAPKKTSMSFFTALSLSLNNLMTKKTRTILTAFAGSIGIIGIALILSLSNGLQSYINRVEEDTLSSYPIMIEQETIDFSALMESFMGNAGEKTPHDDGRIYTSNIMSQLINSTAAQVETNDLARFKTYLEENAETVDPLVTAVSYGYGIDPMLYKTDEDGGYTRVNPSAISEYMAGMSGGMDSAYSDAFMSNYNMWSELMDNPEFLQTQYDVLAGRWPGAYNEVLLIADENNEIADLLLYSLGIKTDQDFKALMDAMMRGETVDDSVMSFSYDEILSLRYQLVLPGDVYEKAGDQWLDMSQDALFMQKLLAEAETIEIVGIVRPNEEAVATAQQSSIGYTSALTEYFIEKTNASGIVQAQLADETTDVFTGLPFETEHEPLFQSMEDIQAYILMLPEEARPQVAESVLQMQEAGMSDAQIISMFNDSMGPQESDATYSGNLRRLAVADLSKPASIYLYPSSFENKEAVTALIEEYNAGAEDEYKISYTDYVGLLMSSVTTVINAISYILIAFVSISLVVSSIMIGIITYISVLERTKEIGILRSIGASKRDVSRVFNAETLVVGFVAGALGILITVLLCIPANAIIKSLTSIPNIAALPPAGAAILILISMLLTFIAGLIPSRLAAKKDPVVALRME